MSGKAALRMNREMTAHRDRGALLLLGLWWVVGTSLGGLIGWVVTVGFAGFSFGAGLLLTGPLFGLCMGLGEAFALGAYLRRWDRYRDWFEWYWSGATIVGATLGWICVVLLQALLVFQDQSWRYLPITPIIVFSVSGAILGLAQWIILRNYLPGARWWILVNAISWPIATLPGLRAGYLIHDTLTPGYLSRREEFHFFGLGEMAHYLVAGSVSTFIYALISSTAVVWLVWASPEKVETRNNRDTGL